MAKWLRRLLILLFLWSLTLFASAQEPRSAQIDMDAMLDPSTLDVRVIQDWHRVDGPMPTRQKTVNILVSKVLGEQEYRIPVRMVVPAEGKARGFHLTGSHGLRDFDRDLRPRGEQVLLLQGGVGLVQTMVQTLDNSDQRELGEALHDKFIETLDPKHSIQYTLWPATLMRAITTAHAETAHFEKDGKIAMSGGSKNGATPSAVLVMDPRTTAVHASVSPIWDSPLRLCDREAWEELEEFNRRYVATLKDYEGRGGPERLLRHPFLGGTYGPIYNRQALERDHPWEALQKTATQMADHVFISRNLEALRKRGVDLLFHPGTHDFVIYDVAWGGKHHPSIPIYLECNAGHGKKPHPKSERPQANKQAFLLSHFFEDAPRMLSAPVITHTRKGDQLHVEVRFKKGEKTETGRIWWMFDRGIDGSAAYLRDPFPDDQWSDMKWDEAKQVWQVEIAVGDVDAETIDFFSNHRRTNRWKGQVFPTYISSPYTRVGF